MTIIDAYNLKCESYCTFLKSYLSVFTDIQHQICGNRKVLFGLPKVNIGTIVMIYRKLVDWNMYKHFVVFLSFERARNNDLKSVLHFQKLNISLFFFSFRNYQTVKSIWLLQNYFTDDQAFIDFDRNMYIQPTRNAFLSFEQVRSSDVIPLQSSAQNSSCSLCSCCSQ